MSPQKRTIQCFLFVLHHSNQLKCEVSYLLVLIHSSEAGGNRNGGCGKKGTGRDLFSPSFRPSEQKGPLLKSISLQGVAQTRCVKWELPGCDFCRKHPLSIVCAVIHERSRVTKVLWGREGSGRHRKSTNTHFLEGRRGLQTLLNEKCCLASCTLYVKES